MSTEKGKEIGIRGWKRSDTFDHFPQGSKGLPSLDPFDDFHPLQ